MLALLNPGVAKKTAEWAARFAGAQPFRHVVIDDFLRPEFVGSLAAAFPAFDEAGALNEAGEPGGKCVIPNLRGLGGAYEQFDDLIRSRDFRAWTGKVTGIADLLYDADYVGGGTHENRNGQELDPHVDFNYHPKTGWHRRLNLILFLNTEWQLEWGGSLELQGAETQTVLPLMNRCVIFETNEHSWHGFRRIELPADRTRLSRRSIAVYYYTRNRPPEELAPHHGTFYVSRPLPEHLQPGYTLTEQDVHELQMLTARRDQQIRFLYHRELQFSRMIHSFSYRLGALLTAPARWLRKSR